MYYLRRVTFYIVTMWAAISFNFLIPRMMPGDPATVLIAKMQRAGEVTPAMIQNIQLMLGGTTHGSLWSQYLSYWGSIFRLDLGVSATQFPASVMSMIAEALPWTIGLVGVATVISFVLGVSLGALTGWKRGTWVDSLVPSTTLIQSVPYFWMALLLAYFFSVSLGWLPLTWGWDVLRFDGPELSWAFVGSVLQHAILPAITIVLSSVGGWLLGMRNMMVSTLSEDYVVTAEAKGLKPSRIFWTYGVRNASIPSIAGFSISLGFVVAGSIVMEQVFSYPGIGKLLIRAVQGLDYTLMQGIFLVITFAVLAANFIMDICYGFIDPRTRHNG